MDGGERFDLVSLAMRRDSSNLPKYLVLANAVEASIRDGRLKPGDGLPSERRLTDLLAVSRITIRRALDELEGKGLIVRRQGAATQVVNRVEKQLSRLTSFSEEIRARGLRPGASIVESRVTRPTDIEREKLNLTASEQVARVVRIRLANEQPIALERAAVPAHVIHSPEIIGASLYATLESLGHPPQSGLQRISASIMNEQEASMLQANSGDPLLVIERNCFTAAGEAIEYTVTRYKADVFDFVTELQKISS